MQQIPGGVFIVFSGPEGGGKSTQALRLSKHLEAQGYSVVLTKEPGGNDPICQEIRSILLRPGRVITGMTELCLFWADRAQHLAHEVRPALSQGAIVLCGRYIADTYAYQCFARKVVTPEVFDFTMQRVVNAMHEPDLTLWFDLPAEIGLSRKHKQEEITRFEHEALEFHHKVVRGFAEYFDTHKLGRRERIAAERPPEEVFGQVVRFAERVISERNLRNRPDA